MPSWTLPNQRYKQLNVFERAQYDKAADLLNLSYHQFRGKLKKHDISGRPDGV